MKWRSAAWGRSLRGIRFLALDIDGVLTDGGVTWDSERVESRRFDIKDGLGIVRLLEAGGVVAVISSSPSQAGIPRLQALGITELHVGVSDKVVTLTEVLARHHVAPQSAAYIGDDLPDLGCLDLVGFPIAPADAVTQVRSRARYVTRAAGGRGAVREVSDLMLGGGH